MYLLYCLLIVLFVYTLPALAIFPQLAFSARLAFAIPVLSALVVYCILSLLIGLGVLSTLLTTLVALSIGAVAIFRLRHGIVKWPFKWSKHEGFLYLFHFILLLPYAIKLGTNAFDRGDEIYSWNFWGIQHYFQETIDFSHTSAPYPQLFPKLLAFCYHLVGSIDLQLPVKATLIVFPWAMLTAIAMNCRYLFTNRQSIYWLLFIFVIVGVGLEQFFNDGYADPIMTSCLIVSASLFWQSQQSAHPPKTRTFFALLSVLCGITAAHTKQPALLWVMFSLPVLLWRTQMKDSQSVLLFRLLSLLSLSGGLAWILGEGQQFHQNYGVFGLSIADRNLFSQLLFSINRYFVHQPLLFILFLLAGLTSWQDRVLRNMVFLFMVPSLVCWFFLGAYHLRLGQHLIAFAFLIVAASGSPLLVKPFQWRQYLWVLSWCAHHQRRLVAGAMIFCVGMGAIIYIESLVKKPGVSLYAGGRQSLQRYFGKDADQVYTNIYSDPTLLLWVPTRYLYGLFYKHTQLTTPDYDYYLTYTRASLVDELQNKEPDYVFSVSQDIIDGPASMLLTEVIAECPKAFERVTHSVNKLSFVTYKIDKSQLHKDPCLLALAKDLPTDQKSPRDKVAFDH